MEGGPEAAAANAAPGARPSPHASTGGRLGRLRRRKGGAQGGLGAVKAH